MVNTRPSRRETDAATPETRRRILDAASEAFAAGGFSGARVDAIARTAGVNKALLYYHVGNKQALYTAVLTRNFDRIERALSGALATVGTTRDRLAAVITAVNTTLRTHPDHALIVLREFADSGRHLETEVLERMMRLITIVRRLLVDGIESGEFRDVEPVMTHLTVIGSSLILNSVGPLRDRLAGIESGIRLPERDSDVAGFLIDLLLNGIAASRNGATP